MQSGEELKKQIRIIDLAVMAGRKRQSPRTGFVHFSSQDEAAVDVIPFYENFCFSLALFRQKNSESILEAKEILTRLFPFQTENGNFPAFLHDFPRCWDSLMPLRIAPIFLRLIQEFSSVLGVELKQKIERSLPQLRKSIEQTRNERPLAPLWEMRYEACFKNDHRSISFWAPSLDAQEWFEWLISAQLMGWEIPPFPYNRFLQAWIGEGISQELGEPRPVCIEWIAAESDGYKERLLRDHPNQLYIAVPWSVENHSSKESAKIACFETSGAFHILWKGKTLHSLAIFSGKRGEGNTIRFDLPETFDPGRGDLCEVEAWCDASAETTISIEGIKGTVFSMGQSIWIQTPDRKIGLRFDLIEGTGEFSGHISRGNRNSQIVCKGVRLYEAYDWRIALRTLRKQTPCVIEVFVEIMGDETR